MASLTGTAEFRAAIETGIASQRKALRAELETMGARMAEEVRNAAPRRTGTLAASVRYVMMDTAKGEKVEVLIGDATADYAAHVEYGDSRSPAHPFARPVFAKYRGAVPGAIEQACIEAWGSQ